MTVLSYKSLRTWTVAVSCSLINLILDGTVRCSGLFFVAAQEAFDVDKRSASVPFAVCVAVRNLSGIFIGILATKYGPGSVTLMGGLVSAIGIGLCFYAKMISWMTTFFGVVFGIGYGMGNILLPLIIGNSFKKSVSAATGFSFCGSCVGSLVLPILFTILLDHYLLHGTLLVTAGLVLNCVPLSMILIQFAPPDKSQELLDFSRKRSKSESDDSRTPDDKRQIHRKNKKRKPPPKCRPKPLRTVSVDISCTSSTDYEMATSSNASTKSQNRSYSFGSCSLVASSTQDDINNSRNTPFIDTVVDVGVGSSCPVFEGSTCEKRTRTDSKTVELDVEDEIKSESREKNRKNLTEEEDGHVDVAGGDRMEKPLTSNNVKAVDQLNNEEEDPRYSRDDEEGIDSTFLRDDGDLKKRLEMIATPMKETGVVTMKDKCNDGLNSVWVHVCAEAKNGEVNIDESSKVNNDDENEQIKTGCSSIHNSEPPNIGTQSNVEKKTCTLNSAKSTREASRPDDESAMKPISLSLESSSKSLATKIKGVIITSRAPEDTLASQEERKLKNVLRSEISGGDKRTSNVEKRNSCPANTLIGSERPLESKRLPKLKVTVFEYTLSVDDVDCSVLNGKKHYRRHANSVSHKYFEKADGRTIGSAADWAFHYENENRSLSSPNSAPLSSIAIPEETKTKGKRVIPPKKSPFLVFADASFMAISLLMTCYEFIFVSTMAVIVDYSRDVHLPNELAKWLVMTVSIGNLLSRLTVGWMTDSGLVRKNVFAAVCFTGIAISVLGISFSFDSKSLLLSCAGFGIFESGVIVMFPLLMRECVDEERLTMALSASNCGPGLVSLLIPVAIGAFRDSSGSYGGLFYFMICIAAACTALCLLLPLLVRRK